MIILASENTNKKLFSDIRVLNSIAPAPSSESSRYLSPFDLAAIDINSLGPRQNGRHFADNSFKCIFLNENVWILIKIPLKFVPKGPKNDIPALIQIMAWRRPGDKPLSEPMMISLLTHICVTRPQCVNSTLAGMFHVAMCLINNTYLTI